MNCLTSSLRFAASPALLAVLLPVLLFSSPLHAQNCSDTLACNYNPEYVPSSYSIVTEVVNADIGQLVGTLGTTDLTGYSTTRVYLQTDNPEDFVSSVSGDADFPTMVSTTTSFHQSALGAATPNGIQALLFPVYPDLVYDSWITIGLEAAPDAGAGEAAISTVASPANAWDVNFEAGGDLVINDPVGGAWFVLLGDANGYPDANGRILLGQFTTDGVLSGNMAVQVFPGGDGQAQFLYEGVLGEDSGAEDCDYLTTYYVDQDGDGYGTTPVDICGEAPEGYALLSGDCNDNFAIAYPGNPNDIIGDGIDGDCDGGETCFRDTDNDGYRLADSTDVIGSPFNINCSEFGEAYGFQPIDCDDENPDLTLPDANGNCIGLEALSEGCSDPLACNYDADAGPSEDNCDYTSCAVCGDPSACNYDASGIQFDDDQCNYTTCLGCSDPEATNYEPNPLIVNDGICVYEGILAIAPIDIVFNDEAGQVQLYTNDVYALLPPDAIQLNAVVGIKGDDIRLRVSPFDSLYQSETCGGWTPSELGTVAVEVDGITYTNSDCYNDSWFTIGGSALDGPDLAAIGFDPATLNDQSEFDSENLPSIGDTLGWSLVGVGGAIENRCEELLGRPGCQSAVRIARFTMPIGQAFSMEAGLTYTVIGGAERTVASTTETSGTGGVASNPTGSGEEAATIDGGDDTNTSVINGCTESRACNYNPQATNNNGTCDYTSCEGCTYELAYNYSDTLTLDDGSCEFRGCQDPGYLEYNPLANISEADSCITLIVVGCRNTDYLEFDAAANVEDFSLCLTPVDPGCMDVEATNYDEEANVSDESCTYGGCTDTDYFEYSPLADDDDGSCLTLKVSGCTDEGFLEFDAAANVFEDGTCLTPVQLGCTYSDAENYSAIANEDDGTCFFDLTGSSSCVGDLDGNGEVATADLLMFLQVFSTSCPE